MEIEKRPRKNIETKNSNRIRNVLRTHGWYTKKVHGGKYQSGLPDILCIHPKHGTIWIETKVKGQRLRQSQVMEFNKMTKAGAKIFVLHDDTEISIIFGRPNWVEYIQ